MKFTFMVISWLLLWAVFIPSCGKAVDKICIKGKSKGDNVVWIQGLNPPYVLMRDGDRILRADCSEFMRRVTLRNQYETFLDYFN